MRVATEILGRRLQDADRFLESGKEEIREGKEKGDECQIRQGFEKLFHALLNAYVARLFAYSQYQIYPETHESVVENLRMAALNREARFFLEMKEIYHARLYYQGEVNLYGLAEEYVETIEQEVRLSRDWVAKAM